MEKTVFSKDEIIALLTHSRVEWNAWRAENPGPIDLSGVELIGNELCYANLRDVNFENTDLSNTDFYGCDLTGANLNGAKLISIQYAYATMSRAQRDLFVAAQDATIKFTD